MSPLGIRLNNPGNIEHSKTVWEGQAPTQPDATFVNFIDPVHGARALMKNLLTHQNRDGLHSVNAQITSWAPPSENDTGAYVRDVCMHIGVKPDDHIDLGVPDTLIRFSQIIARHEQGPCPDPTLPFWYPEEIYEEAARLALGTENA